AIGHCWLKIPESIKITYFGKLNKWVSGKDLILYTIGELGVNGANYKALEFTGKIINELSMASRFTMANMAIEAGAKTGIIVPDETTMNYIKSVSQKEFKIYKSDNDANYFKDFEINCNLIEPQVALPDSPENVKSISEVETMEVELDQVVIGSCTNGRIEDLRSAAKIIKKNKIKSNIRCIIIPGTQNIYYQALKEGLLEIFIKSGAIVSTPTCGPCLGGHMGVLAENEKVLSTTNRNFKGRMGHISSEIYLSNPAIAAASAIKGQIISPQSI
ncbi:MAG: homoaconitate hydratase family protein, partial [Promethearchaeota archaeon]